MAAAIRFCRLSLTPFEDRLTPSITLMGDGISSRPLEADQRITRETKFEVIKQIPAVDVSLAAVDLSETTGSQARPGREIKTGLVKQLPAIDVSLAGVDLNETSASQARSGREIKTMLIKQVPASDASLGVESLETSEAYESDAQQGARPGTKPNPWANTDKRDYPESVIHSTM